MEDYEYLQNLIERNLSLLGSFDAQCLHDLGRLQRHVYSCADDESCSCQ